MSYDLNSLHNDIHNLYRLLDMLVDQQVEIPEAVHENMHNIAALAWVARDLAEKCTVELDNEDGFQTIGSTCVKPAPKPSAIMTIFDQWKKMNERDLAPEEMDGWNALASQIIALPATTAQEFAAKIVCFTDYGANDLDPKGSGAEVWQQALDLVGGEPEGRQP